MHMFYIDLSKLTDIFTNILIKYEIRATEYLGNVLVVFRHTLETLKLTLAPFSFHFHMKAC